MILQTEVDRTVRLMEKFMSLEQDMFTRVDIESQAFVRQSVKQP
jgi:hypothetical protein